MTDITKGLLKVKQVFNSPMEFLKLMMKISKPYDQELVFKVVLDIFNNSEFQFFLHGAGTHTSWLLQKLDKSKFNRIEGVIDKSTKEQYFSKKINKIIYPFSSFNSKLKLNPNYKIIVAHPKSEFEMISDLLELGVDINNIYPIYSGEKYLLKILEKEMQTVISPIKKKTNQRVIVINAYDGIVRKELLVNLEDYLKWDLIEINLQKPENAILNEKCNVFPSTNDHIKMIHLVKVLNPDLIIVRDHFDNYQISSILLSVFHADCPLISTYYDLINIHLENDGTRNLDNNCEKFAIENSTGIIHRGNKESIEYLKDNFKINFPYEFEFQPYISKKNYPEIKKRKLKKIVKLVSAHSIFHKELANRLFPGNDVAGLYEIILQQGFEVDIYFKGLEQISMNQLYSDYLNLQEKYSNLKILSGVSQKELFNILPNKYDFALNLLVDSQENIMGRPAGAKYEIGGRFYFYLSMGLPIITTSYIDREVKLIKENQAGITTYAHELSRLTDLIEKVDYNELLQNVLIAREKFALENQLEPAVNFIKEIVK